MIITRMHIDGFGIFHDADVPDLSPGLNVFFGENEAGKSTLLAFIPTMLYGFPDGRSRLPRYSPLNGGTHGGSLGIRDEALGGLTLARRAGKSRGPLEVLPEDGAPGDERMLTRALGGVSEGLFRSAHAFSLAELASMGALTDDELRAAVAGAGFGSGFLRLDKAAKAIRESKKNLFLPKGSTQPLNRLFYSLREAEQKLTAHEKDAARYFELRSQQEAADTELEGLGERLAAARRDLQKKKTLLALWADHLEHGEARRALDALSALPAGFPDNARALFSDLTLKMEALDRDIADLEADRAGLLKEKEALRPEPRLLAREKQVREAAALGPELAALEREAEAAGRLCDEKEKARAQVIQALGPGFGQARAAEAAERAQKGGGFSRKIAEAGAFVQDLAGIEAAARAGREVLDRALATEAACVRDIEALAEPELRQEELQRRKQALGGAPALLASLSLAEREEEAALRALAENDAAPPPSPFLSPALALGLALFLGAAAVFFYLGLARGFTALNAALSTAGLILSVLPAAALVLLRRKKAEAKRRRSALENAVAKAEEAAFDAREMLRRLCAACGIASEKPDEAGIEERRAALDRDLAAWDARVLARERLERAQEELGREQERQAARENQRSAFRASFSAWLADAGLPADLSPAAAGDALGRVEKAAGLAAEEQAARAAQERAREKAKAVMDEVRALFAALDRPLPSSENAARELSLLADDLSSAVRDRARAAALSLTSEPLLRKIADRSARKEEIAKKRAALFAAAEVPDEQGFLALCRVQEDRAGLLLRLDQAALGLRKISGRSDTDALLAELSSLTREGLADEVPALENAIAGLESRREELLKISADRGGEAGRLAADETAGRLRAEREALLTGISSRSREWAVLAVAEKLLAAAVSRFEKDHQPRVVRRAGELFSEVTGGRYTGLVLAPAQNGQPVPCAVLPSGVRRQPEELSRGTAEQLYLCLRLAYAAGAEGPGARLPLVMDDVLVNFDALRSRQAALAIARAAETNQVLFFTCHRRTVEDFLAAHTPFARYSLSGGNISRIDE